MEVLIGLGIGLAVNVIIGALALGLHNDFCRMADKPFLFWIKPIQGNGKVLCLIALVGGILFLTIDIIQQSFILGEQRYKNSIEGRKTKDNCCKT